VRDFPKQGAAYVLLLSLPEYADCEIPARAEDNGILPEDTPKGWRNCYPPTRTRVEACSRVIAVLDRMVAADPDNGWPHLVKASYLYGLHRDAEALAEVHTAAVAPRFTDYTQVRGDAWNYLCDLRGHFDPEKRAYTAGILFEHFAHMRGTARITANLAYRRISDGSTDSGIEMAMDVTGAGNNMCRQSATFIHALVGKSIIAIGAKALDPRSEPETKDPEKHSAQRMARYVAVLKEHGHKTEANTLRTQWQQSERVVESIRDHLVADNGIDAATMFPTVFQIATGALAVLLISCLLWSTTAVLTRGGSTGGSWDRRAAICSALLSCLVLAPVAVILTTTDRLVDVLMSLATFDMTEPGALSPLWLWLPAGVALVSLGVGLALMLTRNPREGKNRCLPVWSLLVIYACALGSLGYIAYGFTDFVQSTEFFATVDPAAALLAMPFVALVLYALLRAVQSRYGRVRGNARLAFAATMRYGTALAAGLSAIIYLGVLITTACLGVRADSFARNSFKNEAAIVQKALE